MLPNNLNNRHALVKIAFVAILILTTSCVTERAYKRIKAECPELIKDSVTTKIDSSSKSKTDTVYSVNTIAGPIRYIQHPCANLCDSFGHLKPTHIVSHKNGITSEINSVGDSLEFKAKADSLMNVITEKDVLINKLITEKKDFKVTTNVCVETWIQTTYRWSAWIFYLTLIIAIILHRYKNV